MRRAALVGASLLRSAVLRLPVLAGRLLLPGRRTPLVRLRRLRRAPLVGLLPGRRARLVLRGLLPVRIVRLRRAVLRLAVLRAAAVLAALRLLVVVPARPLPVGAASAARQIGPAVHAEQVALLVRLTADRTVQGRHDTSPERTPARSSLDVRCSMSPLRGIPM